MSDRRRINGPPGTTIAPVFLSSKQTTKAEKRRLRIPNELRRIFLQTGVVPSASGSAYLELESRPAKPAIVSLSSTIKLSCTVLGPRPLPRTAAFSPNLQLTASVKFAPFATRNRQGYIRDSTEKDLGLHLENALKGVIIPDRWPKSAIDIAVTVLECEDDQDMGNRIAGLGLFNMLAGCINVAVAALADARVDCLDLLAAGVGAVVAGADARPIRVLDPAAIEHAEVLSSCLVAYLPSRDEIVELWCNDSASISSKDAPGFEDLVDSAVAAARGAQTVLKDVLLESMMYRQAATKKLGPQGVKDVEMTG
ncbi:3'-5'-exoribonuclease [Exophiala xenobiotica]|uniref:3'-5'-exoribonuclease n=1 Tax=Vermiconidia calcicola TaxID=1690605 RepID=A0AAV9PUE4_9PEZI|nr:3'-5'-exoribonuclease [Exophiala xenobiotica]KAK5528155.1 3'-5'-exoribonuclease [Vermiconidia calcicola]KAK5532557.1 3'-5'-exoribonuclease [Chaetothyriales sp. CCFEE 6169]KAK5195974.1 3'-5'-exoribonuclease [Exophiala xenobiotica]KAK5216170.1 3'-5'-exoribonuclease [Exophiala xenobiotica]